MKLLKALHEVSANLALPFEEKLLSLIRLGCDALQMEIGIASEIIGDQYRVFVASTTDNSISAGDTFTLSDTYCADTLAKNAITGYFDTEDDPGPDHPCFQLFAIRSYIGIPLNVEGKSFGTVSFSSSTSRNTPFTDAERDYVMLISEWISTEISRKRNMDELLAKQSELVRQHQLLTQVNELAGVGTWELDLVANKVIWSDSLKALFELPVDTEMTHELVESLYHDPNDRQDIVALLERARQYGEPWTNEVQMVTATGHTMWVETQSRAVFEDGACVRVFGATQDITERVNANRELEQRREVAEQALQSRSLFLANMSHEIRTPINGVLGMLDALSKTPLEIRQKEFCSIAQQSAKALLDLVNDILDFSKIDSGQLHFEAVPINISELTHQQYRIFEHTVHKKGLAFEIDTTPTDGLILQGDPTRLSQILTNLINNAIKFTEKGTVSVKTRALKQNETQYLVQLIVKDTGVGISADRQAAIFSPFQQGDSATTRQYGGTGLGLSIVSQIAEQMHGGIKVSSKVGEGSTFIVALQLSVCEIGPGDSLYGQDSATIEVTPHMFAGSRVLVVEDNEINQIVICEQLKELGIEVSIANNGSEAVEDIVRALTTNSLYDLVLMDCQMPVMDGYEATSVIRQLGGAAQTLPIIALTANALMGEREKCVMAGMNDYLTKPIDVKRLATCITRYLLVDSNTGGEGI